MSSQRTKGHLHSTSLLPVIKGSHDVEPYRHPPENIPQVQPKPAQPPIQPPVMGWNSPRLVVQEVRSSSRIDHLEDRLLAQDRAIQLLLDRLYRVKDDIVDSLGLAHGTWQDERRGRELMQDHITTITSVCARLARDIAVLDEQIKNRTGSNAHTAESMKNLEMHHVAGVTDLRGRVARCDASIAKMSADMKGLLDANRNSNNQHGANADKLRDRIAEMDRKIHDLMGKLEKVYAEHDLRIKHMGTDSNQRVVTLDEKTRALLEDLRAQIRQYQSQEQVEREKLEGKLVVYVENSTRQQDAKLDQLEQKVMGSINNVQQTLNNFEEEIRKERERNEASNRALEAKLDGDVKAHLRKQSDELARLKQECRDGFSTVQDSIINMKKVMDGKYRLLEEQIKREISSIRKMVVLI